jgi:mycothiol synthase
LLKSIDTLILEAVRTLSNFLRRADGAGPPAPTLYHPAFREQIQPGLRLVLGSGGRAADEETVVDFVRYSVQRRINLNDLWVAERGGPLVWAILPIVSPGRTMLLIAPGGQPRSDDGPKIAGNLIDSICDHFAGRGVVMTQLLLDPDDAAALQISLERSFQQMAELLYLQADVRRTIPAPVMPDGYDWLTYSPATHAAFAATIVQSYHESLDCPALNGLRDIDDVIAGHKASGAAGEFDPSLWFVLREQGQPVAVLLLARTGHNDTAELVYLGLVPAARGRGLADLIMRQALHTLGAHGLASLALAVDGNNAPALRLYHRHGLRRIGSKLAMLRDLRRVAAGAPSNQSMPASI